MAGSIKGQYQKLLAAQTHKVKWMVQAMAPVDSGMLQRDITCRMQSVNHMAVVVGNNTDYMPYTEEKWINRPGINPNEGWFAASADNVARMLSNTLGGQLETPYGNSLDNTNDTIDRVMNASNKSEAIK